MIIIAIIIGCILGAIIGINMPIIPYTYSGYLAIAIVAALDSVFKCRHIFSSNSSIRRKNVYKLCNNKKTLFR